MAGDWAGVVDDWRRAYQPALDQARQEPAWRDLDTLQYETLDGVLARRGLALPAADRDALVRGWRQLRPWPDTRDGLVRLRRRHITATLSNGHIALLADLLEVRRPAGRCACCPRSSRPATSPIRPCT